MKFLKDKKNILFILVIILIITIGSFSRLWNLEHTPPGLQYDEAYNGIDGIKAGENGNYAVFYPENNGREGLYINFVSFAMSLFGTDNFGVRLTSAIIGILTLISFYFLLKELKFSKISIALGVFMISFSFWHLNFSRIVYRGIMAPLLIILISFFFLKGIRQKNNYLISLAGALTGLGFHTYISFRIVPLILIILTIFFILTIPGFLKKFKLGILIFIATSLLTAAPLFWHFYQNPLDFTGRSNDVSIFNSPDLSTSKALIKSIVIHSGAFFFYGDFNQRHNHGGSPLIPITWSILLILGIIISTKKISLIIISRAKKKKINKKTFLLSNAAILGQAIFFVMLIPGILSIEGIPHSLRIIGVIPGIFILCLLPIEKFLEIYLKLRKSPRRHLKTWRWKILQLSFTGLLVFIILSGISQTYIYHGIWSKELKTAESFERELFDVGKLIKELPLKTNNFLVVAPEIAVSNDHKDCSLKTTIFSGYPIIKNFLFYRPIQGLANIPCENSQIVFQKSDYWLRSQYQEKCPDLNFEEIVPQHGLYKFWVLK